MNRFRLQHSSSVTRRNASLEHASCPQAVDPPVSSWDLKHEEEAQHRRWQQQQLREEEPTRALLTSPRLEHNEVSYCPPQGHGGTGLTVTPSPSLRRARHEQRPNEGAKQRHCNIPLSSECDHRQSSTTAHIASPTTSYRTDCTQFHPAEERTKNTTKNESTAGSRLCNLVGEGATPGYRVDQLRKARPVGEEAQLRSEQPKCSQQYSTFDKRLPRFQTRCDSSPNLNSPHHRQQSTRCHAPQPYLHHRSSPQAQHLTETGTISQSLSQLTTPLSERITKFDKNHSSNNASVLERVEEYDTSTPCDTDFRHKSLTKTSIQHPIKEFEKGSIVKSNPFIQQQQQKHLKLQKQQLMQQKFQDKQYSKPTVHTTLKVTSVVKETKQHTNSQLSATRYVAKCNDIHNQSKSTTKVGGAFGVWHEKNNQEKGQQFSFKRENTEENKKARQYQHQKQWTFAAAQGSDVAKKEKLTHQQQAIRRLGQYDRVMRNIQQDAGYLLKASPSSQKCGLTKAESTGKIVDVGESVRKIISIFTTTGESGNTPTQPCSPGAHDKHCNDSKLSSTTCSGGTDTTATATTTASTNNSGDGGRRNEDDELIYYQHIDDCLVGGGCIGEWQEVSDQQQQHHQNDDDYFPQGIDQVIRQLWNDNGTLRQWTTISSNKDAHSRPQGRRLRTRARSSSPLRNHKNSPHISPSDDDVAGRDGEDDAVAITNIDDNTNNNSGKGIFKSRFIHAAAMATQRSDAFDGGTSNDYQTKTNTTGNAGREPDVQSEKKQLCQRAKSAPKTLRYSETNYSDQAQKDQKINIIDAPLTTSRQQPVAMFAPQAKDYKGNSVALLVAKLNAVQRDNPKEALAIIDSILQSEALCGTRKNSYDLKFPDDDVVNEEDGQKLTQHLIMMDEVKGVGTDCTATKEDYAEGQMHDVEPNRNSFDEADDNSEESDSDDSTVSSITNPTYQSGLDSSVMSARMRRQLLDQKGLNSKIGANMTSGGPPSSVRPPRPLLSNTTNHNNGIKSGVTQQRDHLTKYQSERQVSRRLMSPTSPPDSQNSMYTRTNANDATSPRPSNDLQNSSQIPRENAQVRNNKPPQSNLRQLPLAQVTLTQSELSDGASSTTPPRSNTILSSQLPHHDVMAPARSCIEEKNQGNLDLATEEIDTTASKGSGQSGGSNKNREILDKIERGDENRSNDNETLERSAFVQRTPQQIDLPVESSFLKSRISRLAHIANKKDQPVETTSSEEGVLNGSSDKNQTGSTTSFTIHLTQSILPSGAIPVENTRQDSLVFQAQQRQQTMMLGRTDNVRAAEAECCILHHREQEQARATDLWRKSEEEAQRLIQLNKEEQTRAQTHVCQAHAQQQRREVFKRQARSNSEKNAAEIQETHVKALAQSIIERESKAEGEVLEAQANRLAQTRENEPQSEAEIHEPQRQELLWEPCERSTLLSVGSSKRNLNLQRNLYSAPVVNEAAPQPASFAPAFNADDDNEWVTLPSNSSYFGSSM